MNYLREILAFNDLLQTNELSTGQIALWYALMYINNKCGWREWFSVPNRTLELYSGLSRSGIEKNRNILKQKKLLDFRSKGRQATEYKMAPMSNSVQESLQGSLQGSLQDSLQGSLQGSLQNSGTLNKQNKNKTKRKYTTAAMCESVFRHYETCFGVMTQSTMQTIDGYLADGVEPEMMIAVFDEAVEHGKVSWKYAKAILDAKVKAGIKTAIGFRQSQAVFQAAKEQSQKMPKKSAFHNYEDQNATDYAALEQELHKQMMEDGVYDDTCN